MIKHNVDMLNQLFDNATPVSRTLSKKKRKHVIEVKVVCRPHKIYDEGRLTGFDVLVVLIGRVVYIFGDTKMNFECQKLRCVKISKLIGPFIGQVFDTSALGMQKSR